MEKICTKCNVNKKLDNYHKNKNIKDGYHTICKECRHNLRKLSNYKVNVDSKKCPKCKLILNNIHFSCDKSSKNGLQTYCKNCQVINSQIYYQKGGKDIFFKRLYKDLCRNAKSRKINVSINLDDIILLYEKNNKCSISGIQMTTLYIPNEGKWKRIHNVSVDRINSNLGYTKDNIQLVCSIINIMKWDLNQNDFINMCHKISLNNFSLFEKN
jgi:hypothetical protein